LRLSHRAEIPRIRLKVSARFLCRLITSGLFKQLPAILHKQLNIRLLYCVSLLSAGLLPAEAPGYLQGYIEKHGFTYDLDAILSRLVYGRIRYLSSKLSCCEQSEKLYEQPGFEQMAIYPSYTRTELTDSIHEMAGFRTFF